MTIKQLASDKYRDGDGMLSLGEICSCELEDFIQEQWLGFCGCGCPESSLAYILNGLELVESRRGLRGDDAWKDQYDAEESLFGTEGGKWLFFYWADKEGIADHGGSVPGWLTEKGTELLALLREWKDEVDDDED